MQTLAVMLQKMYSLGALKSTNEGGIGFISWKQHIAAKRGATINIFQELIGNSPNKTKTQLDRLKRDARRGKRWLPICEIKKVLFGVCIVLT